MTNGATSAESAGSAPASAKAVWFSGPREVEIRSEAVLPPVEGQVTVDGVVSLVSTGTEMVVYRGEAHAEDPMPLNSAGSYAFPIKYGYQVVGRVAESRSAEFPAGTRVFVRHPHQTRFTVTVEGYALIAIPDAVDDVAAAFLNLGRVAHNALVDADTAVGETVVVHGLGIVGSLAARMLRPIAGRIIVVDPVASRRALAERWGADVAVAPDEAAAAIETATQGRGADVSIEASGAGPALQAAIDTTGEEGRIIVVSYYGRKPVPLRLAPEFHWRRQRIISSHATAFARATAEWDIDRRNATVFGLLPTIGAEDLVSLRLPLERAAEGYRALDRADGRDDVIGVLFEHGAS